MNRWKITTGLLIIAGSLSTLAIEKSLPADATAKAAHTADTDTPRDLSHCGEL